MYMPGRSRTGSRPLRTVMSLAPYATRETSSTLSAGGVPSAPGHPGMKARTPIRPASPTSTSKAPGTAVHTREIKGPKTVELLVRALLATGDSLPDPSPVNGSNGPGSATARVLHGHPRDRDAGLVEIADDVGFEIAQLGSPRPVIDVDHENAVAQVTRCGVGGDCGADDGGPTCCDGLELPRVGEAEVARDARDRVAEPTGFVTHERLTIDSRFGHDAVRDGEPLVCPDLGRQHARGGDERLARREVRYQRGRARRIQLAEHVVQQQHRALADHLTDRMVTRETKRQREGPLFTLRGVGPRVEIAQHELPLVTMRSHQGDASLELFAPATRQRGA